jgi:hypothetical protein
VHYDEFLGFLLRFLDASEALFTTTEDQALLAPFRVAVRSYEAAMKQTNYKRETQAVATKSERAVKIYRGLKGYLKSMVLHPSEERCQAAQKVLGSIGKYGSIHNISANTRYALLNSVIEDLQQRPTQEVSLLQLQEWLEGLSAATAEFKMALDAQNAERAQVQKGRVKEAHTAVVLAYNAFTQKVNACAILRGDAHYSQLITEVNALIAGIKSLLKLRATRSENLSDDDPKEGVATATHPSAAPPRKQSPEILTLYRATVPSAPPTGELSTASLTHPMLQPVLERNG